MSPPYLAPRAQASVCILSPSYSCLPGEFWTWKLQSKDQAGNWVNESPQENGTLSHRDMIINKLTRFGFFVVILAFSLVKHHPGQFHVRAPHCDGGLREGENKQQSRNCRASPAEGSKLQEQL